MEIWDFELRKGNSNNPRNGACLLDACSWFEYGTLGDHPPCVCPIIAAYGRMLNDALPDDKRQELKMFLPRLAGTVDTAHELARAEYAVRRIIREILPVVLRLQNRRRHASKCEKLPPEASMAECRKVATAAAAAAAARAAYAATAANNAATYVAYAAATIAAANNAAAAAEAARAAAYAATAATAANADAVDDIAVSILDGMLAIGKQAEPPKDGAWAHASETFRAAALT